uniref:Uncharacterized protein n=1 Tax=Arundo donax TaxID=35708 RepID=A0A0A9HB16_ARUDO
MAQSGCQPRLGWQPQARFLTPHFAQLLPISPGEAAGGDSQGFGQIALFSPLPHLYCLIHCCLMQF